MYMQITILLSLAFVSIPSANDPTIVPWPVGYFLEDMETTKTLMNSYGDPNVSIFHTGIDIQHETTGCDQVRCVYGYDDVSAPDEPNVVISEIYLDVTKGFDQWLAVTTEGTDVNNHEDYGWCDMPTGFHTTP